MKKILIILCILFSTFSLNNVYGASGDTATGSCIYDEKSDKSIGESLSDCLSGSKVVPVKDADLAGGFKDEIGKWIRNISLIFSILAVGSIVYGSLLLTLSTGEDEKIKNGKDVIKWGILGFLCIISATAIITLVVNLMYSI